MKYFSPNILDGSVTTVKLADGAVTDPKIASGAVGTRAILGSAVEQGELNTTVVSTSGTINSITVLGITLIPYAFWPMIHDQDATDVRVSGHEVDGVSADAPRFALYNSAGVPRTYDIDYRYVA